MDLKMKSSIGTPPVWDFNVTNGIANFISGEEEKLQCAQLATYLCLNSTPQLPGEGTDWLGFFTEETTFGEVDSQIRKNINNSKGFEFYPHYELINNKLSTTLLKRKNI